MPCAFYDCVKMFKEILIYTYVPIHMGTRWRALYYTYIWPPFLLLLILVGT